MQCRAEVDQLARKLAELEAHHARAQDQKQKFAQEAEERRRHEEHWREQCAQLEQEAKRLTTELENAEQALK